MMRYGWWWDGHFLNIFLSLTIYHVISPNSTLEEILYHPLLLLIISMILISVLYYFIERDLSIYHLIYHLPSSLTISLLYSCGYFWSSSRIWSLYFWFWWFVFWRKVIWCWRRFFVVFLVWDDDCLFFNHLSYDQWYLTIYLISSPNLPSHYLSHNLPSHDHLIS